jgi:hypothetical protein
LFYKEQAQPSISVRFLFLLSAELFVSQEQIFRYLK